MIFVGASPPNIIYFIIILLLFLASPLTFPIQVGLKKIKVPEEFNYSRSQALASRLEMWNMRTPLEKRVGVSPA
uniref:ATP synthase F0 subunit 8 n=1 Tax=Romanomermis culicivorax TaxID=13658 RepID=A0A915KLV8_ROMCU